MYVSNKDKNSTLYLNNQGIPISDYDPEKDQLENM